MIKRYERFMCSTLRGFCKIRGSTSNHILNPELCPINVQYCNKAKQDIEGITDAHRFKTLRSFNSFLNRVSKLDTIAILTVSQLVMLERTNFEV